MVTVPSGTAVKSCSGTAVQSLYVCYLSQIYVGWVLGYEKAFTEFYMCYTDITPVSYKGLYIYRYRYQPVPVPLILPVLQVLITPRPRSFAVNVWSTSASLTCTQNLLNFLIRLVASLKAIHLHHHVSELIKLPGYEICPPSTTLFKTSIKSYYKY